MVKIYKFFAYFIFFMIMLYAFFPKANLYYQAQKDLTSYKIKIINKTLHENIFSLNLQHVTISYEGVQTAKIAKMHILLLGVVNNIDVDGVILSGVVKNFLPQKIYRISLHYSILHPLEVRAVLKGGFGDAKCFYEIKKHTFVMRLHPSMIMKAHYKSSLRELKKLKNGVYLYETSL